MKKDKIKKLTQEKPFNVAQDRQDEIFRNMSADRKVELGSQLWQLAKDLVGDKINYGGANRSKASFNKHR